MFKKQDSSHVETLSEVGITLKEAEGVEVYVNPDDDDIKKVN